MFYSQFILAKKGPLGTIWIAAHLERKLRKNQVADTDIGISVDSILFPDVPIALRLSSHLLLGVVRIYSRKVNYLFDDCSEALLKIKQAFRSTAVDLPPEESTAPYHSITLPETFDLDDFELPDNDIFQGNYVDHHVSTREQITLQDTMDGVVYSTSQFGLDERFGDGDTSQVGLDLEEDLFLDKVEAMDHVVVSGNDAQTSAELMELPKVDASHERMTEFLEDMPLNGTRNKIEDLASNLEVIDYAQAPSTPGLVEEPNVSSFKERLVCNDHLELEEHLVRELGGMEISENAPSKSDYNENGVMDLSLADHLNHDTSVCTPVEEHSCLDGKINLEGLGGELFSTVKSTKLSPADEAVSTLDGSHKVEDKDKVASCNNKQTAMDLMGRINGDWEEDFEENNDVEFASKIEESFCHGEAVVSTPIHSSDLPSALESVNIKCQGRLVNEDTETLNGHDNNEPTASTYIGALRPCNSHMGQPDILSGEVNHSVVASDLQKVDDAPLSSEILQREESFHASGTSTMVQGGECHVADGVQSEENRISERNLNGEIQADGEKHNDQPVNATSNDNQYEHLNSSSTFELPAPEKLLSLPEMLIDEPHDLLVEIPDKEMHERSDGSGAGTKISGKKRSFAESSVTVQSLNSVESFGASRSKRTVDSIPDDDDLLSSILVGRKSSVLKLKPTPSALEVPSMKRARLASRPSALKRKVLIDDSMVLHGDTIRQQLTSTEDIRRLRKKAPCTRSEILTIQRQFLEEEIFSKPVLTGISADLTRLHGELFDLSGIKVCENDDSNMAALEVVNDDHSARPVIMQDCEIEGTESVGCRNDTDGQTFAVPIQNDNQKDNGHIGSCDVDNQEQMNGIAEIVDYGNSELEHLSETRDMNILNAEVAGATNYSILGVEPSQNEPVPGDICEVPYGAVDQLIIMEKSIGTDELMQVDLLTTPSEKIDNQLIEDAACLRNLSNDIGLCGTEVVDNSAGNFFAVETDMGAGKELLLDESKVGASDEIRGDELADGSAPTDGADTSLANAFSENGGCINFNGVNIDQCFEEIENEKHDVRGDDEGLGGSTLGSDEKDQPSNHLCSDEAKVNSVELDGDFKNVSMGDGDNTLCQLVDQPSDMDTQNAPLGHFTAGECDDIQNVGFANDTDFLNVDDDEVGEDDEGLPDAEDNRLLENSGWSSRTRAVAKYLQTLFDKEAEHGRKVLLMDNLLTGKTRKEASRMFFETLVLKTKDYVHVEQANPFDNINVKPRAKLMKSDF